MDMIRLSIGLVNDRSGGRVSLFDFEGERGGLINRGGNTFDEKGIRRF